MNIHEQAHAIRATLGKERLRRIADYRSDRWAWLAATTEYEQNRTVYQARSLMWQRYAVRTQ